MDWLHKKSYNCHIVVIIIVSISVIIWYSIIIDILSLLLLLLLLLLSLLLLFLIIKINLWIVIIVILSYFAILTYFPCWKGASYNIFFATCEIMCVTNGFMVFKKEFCLLQAVTIVRDSAPNNTYNIFHRYFTGFFRQSNNLKRSKFRKSKNFTFS